MMKLSLKTNGLCGGLKNIRYTTDQHALIEEAIRSMSESDENGERRLERLERFNTVCPYV